MNGKSMHKDQAVSSFDFQGEPTYILFPPPALW